MVISSPAMQRDTGLALGVIGGMIGTILGAAVSSQGASKQEVPDKRLELAYEAGQKRLAMQDATLGNLRTRANTLLIAAALFISFGVGFGVFDANRSNVSAQPGLVIGIGFFSGPNSPEGTSSGWRILQMVLTFATLIGIGVCVIIVLSPMKTGWVYGPSASLIMKNRSIYIDEDSMREYVIGQMIPAIDRNEDKLKFRFKAFRIAIYLLLAEAGVVLTMLPIWANILHELRPIWANILDEIGGWLAWLI